MKKTILLTMCISLLFAGAAFAFQTGSGAWNQQVQKQHYNQAWAGQYGGVSNYHQKAAGVGISAAQFGSEAAEGQEQGQRIHTTLGNGYATHKYDSMTYTSGMSHAVGPGIALHVEGARNTAGTLTMGDAQGKASLSGQGTKTKTASASLATPGSDAATYTFVKFNNGYKYVNQGPTSKIVQAGGTRGEFATVTNKGMATAEGKQAGMTLATNNGHGTKMAGASLSAGVSKAKAVGNAAAIADQAQLHTYRQEAHGPGTAQFQKGFTYTHNTAVE